MHKNDVLCVCLLEARSVGTIYWKHNTNTKIELLMYKQEFCANFVVVK